MKPSRSIAPLALLAATVSTWGCGTKPPASRMPTVSTVPDPAFSVVLPLQGPVGRTLEVDVALERLTVDSSTKLDFGPGVAVQQITPTGAASLHALVTIAPDAAFGPRDVEVRTGPDVVVGRGAFLVTPSLEVDIRRPAQLVQGGFIDLNLLNLAPSTAFDPTGFVIQSPVEPLTMFTRSGTVVNARGLIPPRAETGPLVFSAINTANGLPTDSYVARGVGNVMARDPVDIGDSITGETLTSQDATNVYRHPVEPFHGLLKVTLTVPVTSILYPELFLYGDGGKALDYLHSPPLITIVDQPKVGVTLLPVFEDQPSYLYAVADAAAGAGVGATFDVAFATYPLPGVTEMAGPHADVPGQSADACVSSGKITPCVIRGQISAPGEVDVYQILGPTTPSKIQVNFRSSDYAEFWVQDGSLPKIDPQASEFFDFDAPIPIPGTVQTGTPLLQGAMMLETEAGDFRNTWTVVVRGNGNRTPSYVFAVWDHGP
jgi:hypothetical protein